MANSDTQDSLFLDGNAAAGLAREIFAFDITSAMAQCAGCGVVATFSEARVYGGRMGAICRCGNCESIVLRLVRTPRGFYIDMRGVTRLLILPE